MCDGGIIDFQPSCCKETEVVLLLRQKMDQILPMHYLLYIVVHYCIYQSHQVDIITINDYTMVVGVV